MRSRAGWYSATERRMVMVARHHADHSRLRRRATRSSRIRAAVGDSERDLQAAHAAGCVPHLVLTGKTELAEGQPLPPEFPPDTRVHADLAAFATSFIAEQEAQEAAQAQAAAAAAEQALRNAPGAPAPA